MAKDGSPPSFLAVSQVRVALAATAIAAVAASIPGSRYLDASPINLPLHTAVETVAIVVGCLIWTLVRASRDYRSAASIILGLAFLAAALLDFGHLLSYSGMPDLVAPSGPHKSIEFWLAARLILALALFTYALRDRSAMATDPVRCGLLMVATLSLVAGIYWLILFQSESMPATFVVGVGLSSFKVAMEWLITGLDVLAAILLARRYRVSKQALEAWLATACWLLALGEMFFSFHTANSDYFNLLGHGYKVWAYLVAYQALGQHIVLEPHERLELESSRLRAILETSLDGIHVVDRAGRVLDSNGAFARMLGYMPEEVLGRHVSDFEVDRRHGVVEAHIETLRLAGQSTFFETSLRRKDGGVIDVELSIGLSTWLDEEFLVIVARDLADRKASARLQLAGEVFEHAHVGFLITDQDGRIIEINPTACEITGYSREDLLGKNPSVLKSGVHDRAYFEDMWRALLSQGFWNGEICNRRKTGELYYELLSITAIRNHEARNTSYLAVFTDITRRKLAEEKMRRVAHFDALTGLPNRLLLADRLDQAMASNQRSGKLLAICFMDLDGFKQVNDLYGHEVGDALLREVGDRLQGLLRGSDTVARLGGDEFVMLLSSLESEEECSQALDRVLKIVATPYALPGDRLIEISSSVGVTLYPPDVADADTLLRHADQAMYAAKQAGKNCYQLFDAHMEQRLQARHDTLRRVAHGLSAGQFQLHYQPKVNCRTGVVVGVEALIRWDHPVLGSLSPSEFLPLLEDDDLALSLGEWVFREAMRQARLWSEQGLCLAVSVNAFPRQLQRPNFPDVVAAALHETWPTMEPGRLLIEITEAAAIDDLEAIQVAIQRCRALGIGFSLDDFGTGNASLSYLRQLTVDELKIDQSFVRDMLAGGDHQAIVDGVIGLGRAFSLVVVAEGVETDTHIRHLLQRGCDVMQGYGVARPMSAERVGLWLKEFSANPDWSKR
jgi:diguanylate cyclase (GGDEF)-like protein/PAS domain S-box-containing protein